MNFGPAMTCRAAAVELPALTRLFANIGTAPLESLQPPPFDSWVRDMCYMCSNYAVHSVIIGIWVAAKNNIRQIWF